MEASSSDFFPFFWTSNATPYDADTYCRIPEAKVDQSMKSFGPDVAKKKNYWNGDSDNFAHVTVFNDFFCPKV